MGVGIDGQPNTYNFGLEFDYSVWTEGTVIDLVNVPFNNDYRDVVRFANKDALNAYIDSRKPAGITYSGLSHVKPYQPIRLPISHNRSVKYNYLRVYNPLQPIETGDEIKYFYYFILDTEYVAPETTNFVLQLDVWQTFVYDITLGNCFVERGHIGIANENAFDNYGRDYLTIPEGLDTGTDYQIAMQRKKWIMSPTPWDSGPDSRYPSHDILVFSATDLMADAGTEDDPNLNTPGGSTFQMTTHGAGVYVFDPQSFLATMSSLADKPWITQGIISITLIPKITRYHPGYVYNEFPEPTLAPSLAPSDKAHVMQTNWRDHSDIVNNIPERYRHLKKFWTFPYMAIELTTFMGTPLLLKPEVWNSANADVKERANLVPPAQRIEFYPSFYNSRINSYSDAEVLWPAPVTGYMAGIRGDDYGDYVDIVTSIANFPTMAIVNNGAIGYLAANMHGIAYQYGATDWAQQRALGMNQAQYDVATGAMHTAMDVAGSAINADIATVGAQNTLLAKQALIDGAMSVTGGGSLAGAGGHPGMVAASLSQALFGAMNKGVQGMANDEMLAARQTAAAETVISQNKQQQLMRDTNKQVADWAARGDYSNARAAIDAKVNDAQLIQPTTSGQTGGETMAIVMGGWQVSARWKMIDQARIKAIGEYWLRFGYAVHHEMIPPQSLRVMSKFSYWKMSETYIASSTVPEGFKQALRGILEKGVTVWVDPADIGLIDWADNTALAGVSY